MEEGLQHRRLAPGRNGLPIRTVDELRAHVTLAIQIELSTIPPYLYAMYSIADRSSEPALLLRSIVAEEMLHAALAGNLLSAIGGKPDFASAAWVPSYPLQLPHHRPPLRVDLAPCSIETIRDIFMIIEQPELHEAPPQPDEYETLGQFYHALEVGLRELSIDTDLFSSATPDTQMSNPAFYAPITYDEADSGGLVAISDLDTAIEAIEVIVHQGEGLGEHKWADDSHRELTHYHKLLKISKGSSPLGEIRPVPTNPRTESYPDRLRSASDLFNACYRLILQTLTEIYTAGTNKPALVKRLYVVMAAAMSQIADYLVDQEMGDGTVGAPTFEVYRFSSASALDEVKALAESAAAEHPPLSPIRDVLAVL
jgi:hypothetical protein